MNSQDQNIYRVDCPDDEIDVLATLTIISVEFKYGRKAIPEQILRLWAEVHITVKRNEHNRECCRQIKTNNVSFGPLKLKVVKLTHKVD